MSNLKYFSVEELKCKGTFGGIKMVILGYIIGYLFLAVSYVGSIL